MASDRSDMVYTLFNQTVGRLDDLVTGAAVVLVGYLGTRPPSGPFGLNSSTLELGAIFLFIGSACCGAVRIASHARFLSNEHDITKMDEAVALGVPPQLRESAKRLQATARLDADLEPIANAGLRWFWWRNGLLLAGLVTLVSGRVLATATFAADMRSASAIGSGQPMENYCTEYGKEMAASGVAVPDSLQFREWLRQRCVQDMHRVTP